MAADLFLQLVDLHPEYREFLLSTVVDLDQIDIAVFGKNPEDPCMDHISVVNLSRRKIRYKTDDPEEQIYPYIHVHEESLETAIEILQMQGALPAHSLILRWYCNQNA